MIYDGIFTLPSFEEKTKTQQNQIIERLRALSTPIVIGSFSTGQKVIFRKEMDLNRGAYEIKNYIQLSETQLPQSVHNIAKQLNMRNVSRHYVYGPNPAILNAIPHVGHILYAGDGKFAPFLRISDSKTLPYFYEFCGPFSSIFQRTALSKKNQSSSL